MGRDTCSLFYFKALIVSRQTSRPKTDFTIHAFTCLSSVRSKMGGFIYYRICIYLKLNRFRRGNGFKLRIDFSMVRVQIPDDLRILQQILDVSLRRLQGEHVFRIGISDRF